MYRQQLGPGRIVTKPRTSDHGSPLRCIPASHFLRGLRTYKNRASTSKSPSSANPFQPHRPSPLLRPPWELLRIRTRHGQLDSVERWRRDDDNDYNASHFSVHPAHGEDASPNAGSFPQTCVAIPTTRTFTAANLAANENITQCMHHRAYGDLVDDC